MADRAPANPRPSAGEMEFASRLSSKRPVSENQRRPAAIGEAMARAGLISTVAAGQRGTSHARGSASAALGSGRNVLDRGLRGLVRLDRAHLLVRTMMADMLDMMAAHLGIGVQRTGLRLAGLGGRRLGGL